MVTNQPNHTLGGYRVTLCILFVASGALGMMMEAATWKWVFDFILASLYFYLLLTNNDI